MYALIICLFLCFPLLSVDTSYFIADMKYSEKEGIKICELQQGTLSAFTGYDYSHSRGAIERIYPSSLCEIGRARDGLDRLGHLFYEFLIKRGHIYL